MRYLMFIKHSEAHRSQPIPPGLLDAMGKFVEAGFKNGTLLDTAGLKPTKDASRVRLEKGRITVTDGPFTEAKEAVGGYALIKVDSRDEAMKVAREFMDLHRIYWPEFTGECEVRPLEDMPA